MSVSPSDLAQEKALEQAPAFTLAIAATFTAEPVEESLRFWSDELDRPLSIEFAPYSQVFQQLLDPTSLLSQNQKGINVVLVRLEDWEPNADRETEVKPPLSEAARQSIERNIKELAIALHSATERSSTPYLVCVCPASEAARQDAQWQAFLQAMEAAIAIALEPISSVYLVTSAEILTTYPVPDYDDPYRNKVGHVPYTPEFYTALGTIITRKMSAILRQPYKVIALDCDRTLWNGVCGEDGALGITLDPPWQVLQEFMVAQHEAGMLLCLCSKNSEADVVEVFERRSDMPLQRKHIVSWRINWQSKADNLKALAQELNLGLDSFIFIDDNPVECAEVQANCPEVLTLQLPDRPEDMPQFLRHVWAFDRLKVTQEDKQRTELYKQNVQREQLRTSSLTLEAFLESLNLDVHLTEPTPEQLARVAQLTQRTNQFNVTTIRRSESEIQQLCQSGQLVCRIVEVSDRFGDYGLVGVLLFTTAEQELSVDTFLLSCRTLGRGVEHRMLAQLGAIAIERGCTHVVIPYHPTQKNEPALNFLQGVGVTYQRPDGEGFCFSFPAQIAAELTYQPRSEEPDIHQIPEKSEISGKYKEKIGSNYAKRLPFLRIATELNTPAKIFQLIDSQQQRTRTSHAAAYVAPQTPVEQALAEIWQRAIGINRVGLHDNFFDLGGNSLLALSLFAQIKERFGQDLPLTTLFQSPTIAQLSKRLEGQERSADWSSLVAIQPNGSRRAFFFVHAAGGGLLQYQKLAAALGNDQPFYGLESLGMDGKKPIPTTIEEMAAHYIQEIRAFQPEGPYLIGGLCFGGLIAFEMAQQLKAQGQEVPLLLLFNTTAPGALRRLSFWERLWQHITNLWRLGPSYALKKLKGKLGTAIQKRQQKSRSSTHTKLRSNKLSGSPDAVTRGHGDAERSVTSLTATPYQKMKVNPTTEGTASYKERYKPVAEIHRKAQQRYVPTLYPGKVTLFQTEGDRISPPGYYQDPHWGWRNLAGGGLEIHVIPGRHNAVLLEANIPMQAKTLRACLDQVQPEILDTMSLIGR